MPLYPNLCKEAKFDENGKLIAGPIFFKVDAGPGRLVADHASILKRKEFFENGIFILFGLPDATAVHQEMDDLSGPFKSATHARIALLMGEKLKEKALEEINGEHGTNISLSFADLPVIINGRPGDDINN